MVATGTHGTARDIGKLCVGGDWACAHGDFAGLRDVVQQLSAYTPEPTHCALVELADACIAEPARAAELWEALKERIFRTGEA